MMKTLMCSLMLLSMTIFACSGQELDHAEETTVQDMDSRLAEDMRPRIMRDQSAPPDMVDLGEMLPLDLGQEDASDMLDMSLSKLDAGVEDMFQGDMLTVDMQETVDMAPVRNPIVDRAGFAVRRSGPGIFVKQRIDAQGVRHMVHMDNDTREVVHMKWDGMEWQETILDKVQYVNDSKKSVDLALDAMGNPHVVYHKTKSSTVNNVIRYDYSIQHAWWDGMTWRKERVDSSKYTMSELHIALDSKGHVHLAYVKQDVGRQLVYMIEESTGWRQVPMPNITPSSVAFALDSKESPLFVYYSNRTVSMGMLRQDGNMWKEQTLGRGMNVGLSISLALDSKDDVHVVYPDRSKKQMMYSKWDGQMLSSFAFNAPATGSSNPQGYGSIFIDDQDHPHVVSCMSAVDLRYWSFDGQDWSDVFISSEARHNSLVVDTSGHVFIAAVGDRDTNSFNYFTWNGVTWNPEYLGGRAKVGEELKFALDAQNRPHLVYFNESRDTLDYATLNGKIWETETIDEQPGGPWSFSLAVSPQGQPHVSYYQPDRKNIRYATKMGSQWTTTTLESSGDVGRFSAVALSNQGDPRVAYYDDRGWLRHIEWKNQGWEKNIVDNARGRDVGLGVSMDVDTLGHSHIAYLDGTNGSIKYATKINTEWRTQTMDASMRFNPFISLKVSAQNLPHVIYSGLTRPDLYYSKLSPQGTWKKEEVTLRTQNHKVLKVDLALDAQSVPHLSYQDEGSGFVAHTTPRPGGRWLTKYLGESSFGNQVNGVAIDSFGNPHVVFYELSRQGIMYTLFHDDKWWPAKFE